MINEAYLTTAPKAAEWKLPSARKVAIVCLILTETTLFSIFVAGYIFYIGKSLTGPTPREVLDLPVLAINIVRSARKGELAGNDPWDAWTLEWSTSSPPPDYNFATTPTVRSRRPLWDLKHPEDPDWKYE